VLGDPDDPRTEIEKIIACSGVPVEFPDDAAAQGRAARQELGPEDRADRIDLRDRRFCTIDPETARDFDDALCIEDGPHGGPRVWVAVADVSHYVRWDDALDRESQLRGVSVYLPDRVIPMLPFELSSGICSLNPNVDRCAMVVRLDYHDDGSIADIGYAAAVIQSQARLDYPGVAAALSGDFRGRREIYRPWIGELERLYALSRTLRARRKARGSLDLDLPEPKVILDADDPRLVRDVVRAKADPEVKKAYELVEEFMIAANEAVGTFFRQRNAPTVWRVHAPPERERVELLAELMGAYGIKVDVEAAMTPLGMKDVLEKVAQSPASRSLGFLVLRSLKQAVWDTVPIGHFGLASGDYLHFTSPIRRYPDLLVHRLLKHHLHREGQASGGGYAKAPPPQEKLAELASTSSGHERRAMEAEREAVSMYRCYLVRDQIGEHFSGTVSAATSFGAFVEIDEPYVEGLIRKETLGDDVSFDEIHMRLSSRRSGRTLTLGDQVQVEIVDVSVVRRRVELKLLAVKRSEAPKRLDLATGDDYEAPSRVGIAARKKAGRAAVAAAIGGKSGRRDAKPRIHVSHKGKPKRR
jgi:ribonuclease R